MKADRDTNTISTIDEPDYSLVRWRQPAQDENGNPIDYGGAPTQRFYFKLENNMPGSPINEVYVSAFSCEGENDVRIGIIVKGNSKELFYSKLTEYINEKGVPTGGVLTWADSYESTISGVIIGEDKSQSVSSGNPFKDAINIELMYRLAEKGALQPGIAETIENFVNTVTPQLMKVSDETVRIGLRNVTAPLQEARPLELS